MALCAHIKTRLLRLGVVGIVAAGASIGAGCMGNQTTDESAPAADSTTPSAAGEGAAAEAPVAAGSGAPIEVTVASREGSGGAEPQLASLWVGLYCTLPDEAVRSFSFYVDGRPVQALETNCTGARNPDDGPPNGGQFRVPSETGVVTVRMQNDSDDFETEQEVAITGDHWLVIQHRVLPGGTGHMTTLTPHYERPAGVH